MHGVPHQQSIAPWAAPFPASAAAPSGLAQQLPSPPNSTGDRSSPPPGAITRRPRVDKKTGRTGEEILVCWLTPAPPNPFGHKFQKEWRVVTDPSRAQEVSWEARVQAQKYQEEFGLNLSSAVVGASRPQQQPRRIPYPGPKPNVEISGLSKKDKKKIIEDWQRQVDEYSKQEKRDAEAAERSDKNNTKPQRSQSQNPMSGYQDAYLQQQFLQQHQPSIAGPSNQSRRPSFSASPWQAQQQQPFTPSQPQSGIGWPSPNQSAQLHRSSTYNGSKTNSVRMPGTGTDDLSDIETKLRMAMLAGDKPHDGYISAAEERGRERQRRISGGLLGLTSRSRSRAPEGGAMGYGTTDPSQVQNVWDNGQQRQRKISTAERPAFYPQAGGANMGQYQQGVAPQQPSPNMQQGYGRRVPVNESANAWEQNTRTNPGRPQRDDDDDDDDDDYDDEDYDDNNWDRHKQSSAPSQMPHHARTQNFQHQKTPSRHAMTIQQQQPQQVQFTTQPSPNTAPQQMWPSRSPMIPVQTQLVQKTPSRHAMVIQQHQPQQVQFATQPSPNTAPQQIWPSHSPMIPGQTQLAGGIIPSPMAGAKTFQSQPSPNQPQYIQMAANGLSGHPSPMIQPNVMQGGVYPPGHVLAGKPVNQTAFTKTPARPAQPLMTPAIHAQSFPAQATSIGDQLAAKLSQVQPVPVGGGYVIPEGVTAAIAHELRGPQPPRYGLPQPPQLIPVPTGGGGGILTSAGGIIPGGYRGPQQQQQPQPHESQQRREYHLGQPSSSHMDSYQSYDGSSLRGPLNPGADRGAESDYELLRPPKRSQQHQKHQQHQQHQQRQQHQHQHQQQQQQQQQQYQQQHHEQQWQQLQRQQHQQQHQVRQTQHNPRFTPQGRFEPLIVIPDLNALGEFPVLPKVLDEMMVRHQDWAAFMQEILGAWQDRNPVPGKYGTAARQVSEIVDKWNVALFKQLGVDVAFFRGHKRKSGDARTQYDTRNDELPFFDRAAPLDDDDDDDSSDDDDDGGASILGSQISQNSTLAGGRQLSARHMLQLEEMRRERKRVLEEKRLAKRNTQQYEPAHSIAVFPVIPT